MAAPALLSYRVAIASFDASEGSGGSKDLVKDPPVLDSFSEPAVACALLKQEADRLLAAYDDKHLGEEAGKGAALAPGSDTASLVQALRALDARVWDVHLQLSRKLLHVYFERKLLNEAVDQYLQMVGGRPERYDVRLFSSWTLECAQECGRAQDVRDALRHLIQVHPAWPEKL